MSKSYGTSRSDRKDAIPESRLRRTGKQLVFWYQQSPKPYPWRLLWEKTHDPYAVWVSEIMLQQTTIPAVLPKYLDFMEHFPTVGILARSPLEDVLLQCRGLGYYRRFRTLHRAAREIVSHAKPFNDPAVSCKSDVQWPNNYEEWLGVPGVGPYTAAALASITRNEAVPVIDGNVERVMQRFLGENFSGTTTQLKRWLQPILQNMLAPPFGDFNQALMELGQSICTKSSPQCEHCPIAKNCRARSLGLQTSIPAAKQKSPTIAVGLDLFIAAKHQKIGLYQRDSSYQFLPDTLGFHYRNSAKQDHQRPIGSFSHAITQHKISVSVFVEDSAKTPLKWVPIDAAESLLVSNLDRKALSLFLKHQASP